MIAFATFLIMTSFIMALLSFFTDLAPKKPAWLNKVYRTFSSVPLALGSFGLGFILLFIFG